MMLVLKTRAEYDVLSGPLAAGRACLGAFTIKRCEETSRGPANAIQPLLLASLDVSCIRFGEAA